MILVFQCLFSLFSLFAVFSVWKKRTEGTIGPKGAAFWVAFWVVANIAVWWPNSTTILANRFGIGRGTDLVLYISLATIFYLLFKLHVKVEITGREITKVVRSQALENAVMPGRSHTLSPDHLTTSDKVIK